MEHDCTAAEHEALLPNVVRAYGNGKYELGIYEGDPAGAVGAEAGAVPVHTALVRWRAEVSRPGV